MGRKRRIIVGLSIAAVSIAALYFGGGIIAVNVVCDSLFVSRQSSLETLNEDVFQVFKTQKDYPELSTRTLFTFPSGNNTLQAYKYAPSSEAEGTVFVSHGMKGLADGTDAEYQQWFLHKGYEVISIDLSSCGLSSANAHEGPCQSPIDIANLYKRWKEDKDSKIDKPLYLIGHSWGAYGAACSLEYGVEATGVITFAAFDNPRSLMFDTSQKYAGFAANITKLPFDMALNMKYGSKADLSSSKVIESHPKVRSLHFYGDQDERFNMPASLYGNVKESATCKKVLLPRIGHKLPWLEEENRKTGLEILSSLKNKSAEEKATILKDVDKEKTSILSEEVFHEIELFLGE